VHAWLHGCKLVDANAYANNTHTLLAGYEIGTFHAAPAETEWDAYDVRVYTDTRVIMGLLKMMHRRNIFRLCGEHLFPDAYTESRVYDDVRIHQGSGYNDFYMAVFSLLPKPRNYYPVWY